MYWLTYSRAGELIGVVIIEALSLMDARMRAALEEADVGADFAEGHELDTAQAARVPKQLGHMLSIEEAERLMRRLEAKGR